jgi:hypothetical protein
MFCLVNDLMKLMQKNQDIFGKISKSKGVWQSGIKQSTAYVDVGIQVDNRDSFGK